MTPEQEKYIREQYEKNDSEHFVQGKRLMSSEQKRLRELFPEVFNEEPERKKLTVEIEYDKDKCECNGKTCLTYHDVLQSLKACKGFAFDNISVKKIKPEANQWSDEDMYTFIVKSDKEITEGTILKLLSDNLKFAKFKVMYLPHK